MSLGQSGLAGIWVCGTDTGVGKTVVSSGLVRALALRGCRVTGLKPVVSGSLAGTAAAQAGKDAVDPTGVMGSPDGGEIWEDLLRLSLAGGVPLSDSERAVYRLQFPAAPQFAAALEGLTIAPAKLLAEVRAVAACRGEFAVVEGVGGLRVPLAPGYDSADLARDLAWPTVLVVGIRLGCINHALLTAEALAARGIPLLGWVANCGLVPDYFPLSETIAAIDQGLGADCVARFAVLPGGESLPRGGADQAWLAGVEAQIAAAAVGLGGLAERLWPGRAQPGPGL